MVEKIEIQKKKLEKQIALAKHVSSFMDNASTLLFTFLVLFLILLYQMKAFKKDFELKLLIFVEIAALAICMVMLCVSLINLLYVHNKQKELEAAKSDEKEKNKNAIKIKLKDAVPYLGLVASSLFFLGELLAVIAMFSNFPFGVIPKKSKISFHSMIDIVALCILLISSIIVAFDAVQKYKEIKGTSNDHKQDESLRVQCKKEVVKLAVAVFAVFTTALSLSGRAIVALEVTGNFSLFESANGFVPLGIPLRITAMLLPFVISAIATSLLMVFSEEEKSSVCELCSLVEPVSERLKFTQHG